MVGIFYPKREATGRGSMLLRVVSCQAIGFIINDQINIPLPPQAYILRAMPGNLYKAEHFKHRFQRALFQLEKLDILEAIQVHRIVCRCVHVPLPALVSQALDYQM